MDEKINERQVLEKHIQNFINEEQIIEKEIVNVRQTLRDLEQKRDQIIKEKEIFCLTNCNHDFEYEREEGPYGARFRVCKICNYFSY